MMNCVVDVGVERSVVPTHLKCFQVLIIPQELPSEGPTSKHGTDSCDSAPDADACDCIGRTKFRSAFPSLRYQIVRLEINLLVFQATPQPFHENVVHPSILAVYVDPNTMAFQNASKIVRRELGSLVRI